MANRALEIESLLPVATQMRDRFDGVWGHAVLQGRMFASTYLAFAHKTTGGVAEHLKSPWARFRFHRDASDWIRNTTRAETTFRTRPTET
jgi:hypothetical protein